jgi:salicylate hydroxylase
MRRVAIVGAGLGGLAAAVALRQRGFDVMVFEQSPTLGEVGAGIQVAPNAMKVLRALGLDAQAMAVGSELERHVIRDFKTGRIVSATPMKDAYRERYGAGTYGFHRADLHSVLLEALPRELITLDARCVAVQTHAERATLQFADGSEYQCDAVIGADGIHSVIREALFGPSLPRFTNVVCWRGLVPTDALSPNLIERDMTAWFGPHSTIVHYYLRRGEIVNWAGFCDAENWREESWRTEGDRDEALGYYQGWHPGIAELISKTEVLYKWALFDRDPLPQWTRGRVTLLGDAAHPMLPYLAQGACMALEDAYAVAAALARPHTSVEQALAEYQAARLPRTARVQLASRARAPINQMTSPLARLRRDVGMAVHRLFNPKQHTYKIEWIHGYDVTAADNEASRVPG